MHLTIMTVILSEMSLFRVDHCLMKIVLSTFVMLLNHCVLGFRCDIASATHLSDSLFSHILFPRTDILYCYGAVNACIDVKADVSTSIHRIKKQPILLCLNLNNMLLVEI